VVLVRPRQVPLERQVDEMRMSLGHLLVAEAKALNGARAEVLQHHVGGREQPVEDLAALVGLEVDRDALLVAVVERKVAGPEPLEPPRRIAVRGRLDPDHLGAEVCHHEPRRRPHHRMAEVDDADAGQRPRRRLALGHRTNALPCISRRAVRPISALLTLGSRSSPMSMRARTERQPPGCT
jgi:hypothetical protein